MLKRPFILSIIFIIIIIIGFVIGGSIGKKTSNVTAEIPKNIVTYYCQEGAIVADYGTSSVAISLSDGRTMVLPQTISGSGIRYETNNLVFWSKGDNAFVTEGEQTTYSNCVSGIEKQVEGNLINYTDTSKTFSFSFQNQFSLFGEMGYSQDWTANSTSSGILLVEVMIPKDFMPKTNFGESKFTIGTSADPDAIATCLISQFGNMETATTTTINGVEFTKLHFTDAGAGNFYDTTSYRTIHNNQCYAIEYTIHSSNIYNYSPDQGITAFDQAKVQNIFESMVQSFKFL